ncbi:MAG: SDR family NAD(P)-dependent oxidoreductase, partial [Planctomycetota bacterium]|nr:SDR family NAD(P)-dependent oxidoreductase [Planctomycetota bacterium]
IHPRHWRRGLPTTPSESTPVALVTGAGSGIGREVARQLSDLGFACVLCGRRVPPLEETASLLRGPALLLSVDLSKPRDVERMVDQAFDWRGRLDVLVNNAGWSPAATISQTDAKMIEQVFALNAMAPALTIARAWPRLTQQAAAAHNSGRPMPRVTIVNVSSMAVKDPFAQLYAYAAAKASTHLLARSAANEGQTLNIKAFAVAPGAVETELLRTIVTRDMLPEAMTLAPAQVAAVIVDCIRGEHDAQNGEPIWVPSPTP